MNAYHKTLSSVVNICSMGLGQANLDFHYLKGSRTENKVKSNPLNPIPVAMSAFTDKKALQFLDDEKGDDATEDAQADRHVVAMALSVPSVGMPVRFMRVTVSSVAVTMSVSLLSSPSIDRIVHTNAISLQGDPSPCSKPPVDIDVKVEF